MVKPVGEGNKPVSISPYEKEQITSRLREKIAELLKQNPTDDDILELVRGSAKLDADKIPEKDLHELIAQERLARISDDKIREADAKGLEADAIAMQLLGPEAVKKDRNGKAHLKRDAFTEATLRAVGDRILRITVHHQPSPAAGTARFAGTAPIKPDDLRKVGRGELSGKKEEVRGKIRAMVADRQLNDYEIKGALTGDAMRYVSEGEVERIIVEERQKGFVVDSKERANENLARILGVAPENRGNIRDDYLPETRETLLGIIQEELDKPRTTVAAPNKFSAELVKQASSGPAKFTGKKE